jgi:hypothetical protein
MQRSVRVGALAVALAFATGSLLLPLLASPASAAAQSATCGKVTSSNAGGKLTTTYALCTPTALKAGGVSTLAVPKNGPLKGKLISTVTWKNNQGTTKNTYNYAPASGNGKCAASTTRLKISGKVLNGTGAVAKIIKVGEPVTASVCITKATSAASLEPGTKLKL